MDFKRINCIIPARGDSSRVKNKMTRRFIEDHSLLSWKINILQKFAAKVDVAVDIYVSTSENDDEDQKIREIAKASGAKLHFRDSYYCRSHKANMSEVLLSVVKDMPWEDVIFWTPAVVPFHHEDDFVRAYEVMNSDDFNEEKSLLGVNILKEFFWSPFTNEPINYHADKNHPYSQDIDPVARATNSLYAAKTIKMIQNEYFLTSDVEFLELDYLAGIDIDDIDEFEIARKSYEYYLKKHFSK